MTAEGSLLATDELISQLDDRVFDIAYKLTGN
jgi:hypothetical protein